MLRDLNLELSDWSALQIEADTHEHHVQLAAAATVFIIFINNFSGK